MAKLDYEPRRSCVRSWRRLVVERVLAGLVILPIALVAGVAGLMGFMYLAGGVTGPSILDFAIGCLVLLATLYLVVLLFRLATYCVYGQGMWMETDEPKDTVG